MTSISPRHRLGVPAGSRIQGVRFLRCANGANIELFEFYSIGFRSDSCAGLGSVTYFYLNEHNVEEVA
jgi:hypothetical protein